VDWRIELAQHAAERSAAGVHRELGRGLSGLATVAATAPFVGMLGNVVGVISWPWSDINACAPD
jgi:biopolymer transport protein ExbB/TolQ